MALTQFAIVNAARADKPYKLSDGGGLYLLVSPAGGKLWRFRFFFGGRENMMTLGSFPIVTIAEARGKRDEAKKLLAAGISPSEQKKAEKVAATAATQNTFGLIAAEYIANLEANKIAKTTLAKNRWLLEVLAAPLADRPITEITPAELLNILKRIEKSGRRESAKRLRGVIGAVFRYAVVTLRATSDPTALLRGALLKPIVNHRAAITDEMQVGGLMRSIDEFDGWPTLRAALLLTALTMARPGDIRGMRRSEINFEKALWRIPPERMKMRRPHDVPLSKQAINVLKDIWSLSDNGDLVLPAIRSHNRMLSENAMNSALRRMGYTKEEMTSHGFRSTASTILNERGFSPDVIEAALAHQDDDPVRRAYNRATYLQERTKLMQEWSDLLDSFRQQSATTKRRAA
jgi:integrase